MHARKGMALLRANHTGEVTLVGSRCLRSTFAAAPVLFAHAAVTETQIGRIISPTTAEYSIFITPGFTVLLYGVPGRQDVEGRATRGTRVESYGS